MLIIYFYWKNQQNDERVHGESRCFYKSWSPIVKYFSFILNHCNRNKTPSFGQLSTEYISHETSGNRPKPWRIIINIGLCVYAWVYKGYIFEQFIYMRSNVLFLRTNLANRTLNGRGYVASNLCKFMVVVVLVQIYICQLYLTLVQLYSYHSLCTYSTLYALEHFLITVSCW